MTQQILAVTGVLLLLTGSLWWLRKRGWAAAGLNRRKRRLASVDRLALTPHHALHLVTVNRCLLLVGTSPQSCIILQSFGDAQEPSEQDGKET